MNRILALSSGLAVLAGATAARAQPHPVFLPTRDVAVTYALSGGSGQTSQTTHLFYSAALDRLRIDTPNDGGYTVLDRAAHQRVMVMNQERSYVAIPLDPGADEGFVLNSAMTYRRQGRDIVAGLACTVWAVTSAQATGSACVTDDGVLLRGDGTGQDGGRTSLVATDVQYAPQPAGLFSPPPGFQQMQPEREGQQGGGPPRP